MILGNDPLWRDMQPHDTRLLLPVFILYIVAKVIVFIISKLGSGAANTPPAGGENITP